MITIQGFGIPVLVWFTFMLASTYSWVYAYMTDGEDQAVTMMYGRHFLSLIFGMSLSWWFIGIYEPPYFAEPFIAVAILVYVLTSIGISSVCWLMSIRLQSRRVAKLITNPGDPVIGLTYETEWICFMSMQTIAVLIWGAREWRLLL